VRIQEILRKRTHAVMCGGSGLYIRAVIDGFDDIPEIDPEVRSSIIQSYEQHGITWLQEMLSLHNADPSGQIDLQNPHRLIRALEVKLGTGMAISTFHGRKKREHTFSVARVGLELPREALYQRIDYRVDEMIRAGLFDEARQLYPYRSRNALQTVGYNEIFDFIEGAYDYDEAVRLLKRNSRRYAKRQLTWFKRDPEMKWFDPAEIDNIVKWIDEVSGTSSPRR
jgi:tRNA dimethylallyltransferase